MKTNIAILQALYDRIYNIYNEWTKANLQNNGQWSTERICKYNFGPVLGLYLEKDKCLIDILNDEFSDKELCTLLIPIKERALNKLLEAESNLLTEYKSKSYQDELELLRGGKIKEWIDRFFIPCFNIGIFEIDKSHFRGLCYVMYGYENYQRTESYHDMEMNFYIFPLVLCGMLFTNEYEIELVRTSNTRQKRCEKS